MEIVIVLSLGGLFIIGVIAVVLVALGLRHKRKVEAERKAGESHDITQESIAADPSRIQLGQDVYLPETLEVLTLVALDYHMMIDEDKEPVRDDEENYWTLTLQDDTDPERIVHLTAHQDDEDRWVWQINEQLSDADINRIPELKNIHFTGDDGAPPRELERFDAHWVTDDDSYDYSVYVESRHKDRTRVSGYHTQVTDYYEANAAGRQDGERELSVELWEARQGLGTGRCVTIGRPYHGKVKMLPASKK